MSKSRETQLDVLRSLALLRVVVFHTLWWGWITFLYPSIGVMFAIGGSLALASVDRYSADRFVLKRLCRLLPPLWMYAAVLLPLMMFEGWHSPLDMARWIIPVLDPVGNDHLQQTWRTLWYLRTYVWLIAFTPLLAKAFRRFPKTALVIPFVVLPPLAMNPLLPNGIWTTPLLDFLAYAGCWMVGFAHRDGLLQRMPRALWLALIAICGAVATFAYFHLHNRAGMDVTEDRVVSAYWSTAFALVLLRVQLRIPLLAGRRVVTRLVSWAGRRSVSIYLWHMPSIMLTATAMAWFGLHANEPLQDVLAVLLSIGLTIVLAATFGRVEDLAKILSDHVGSVSTYLHVSPYVRLFRHQPVAAESSSMEKAA